MRVVVFALTSILVATWALPETARAEFFFDVYLGGNVTEDTDGVVEIGAGPQISASGPIDFKAGPSGGFRGGYWLGSVPWLGFALGMPAYDPEEDESGIDVYVFPITALLMLRYPLAKDEDYPQGRLQPYAGVGPGVFVSTAKLDLSPLGAPEDLKDTRADVGLHTVAGVKFHVFSSARPSSSSLGTVAVFVEYGFTRFDPSDFDDDIAGVPVRFQVDRLQTHHAVAGVSLHF
jgi:hypothetical protein